MNPMLDFLNDNGKPENHEYIGDGVYVSMDDYDTVLLATERENGIHFIFLEQRELRNLIAYAESRQR